MRSDITEQKAALRSRIRRERAARDLTARSQAAGDLFRHAVTLTTDIGARVVASYLPYRGEPALDAFHDWAFSHDVDIIVPRTHGRQLSWEHLSRRPRLEAGFGGVPQPVPSGSEAELEAADLVFVPAAAVDPSGRRLGWGAGFYDRALTENGAGGPVVAVNYDSEVVEELPVEPHDRKVDGILTPAGFRWATTRPVSSD